MNKQRGFGIGLALCKSQKQDACVRGRGATGPAGRCEKFCKLPNHQGGEYAFCTN